MALFLVIVVFLPIQPDRVIIVHQLEKDEVESIIADLSFKTYWTAALYQANLSAGHFLVIEGRGSTMVTQIGIPPFIAL